MCIRDRGTTELVMDNRMITCMCSGMSASVRVLNIVATSGTDIATLTTDQADNAEAYNTCLQTSLGSLCTSTGFATFAAMGATAVDTCCSTAPPGGAGGTADAVTNNDCAIGDGTR